MKLLITGANGFLGQHVTRLALMRDHCVRALARPHADTAPLQRLADQHDNLHIIRHDLRNPADLAETLAGLDAVIHLAAVKAGSFYTQMAGTVVATENLLNAMRAAAIDRLVLVSTFAVYDYLALPVNALLDETGPLEADPVQRDDYCRTKLLQERLARQAEHDHHLKLTVLRPGVIYADPDNLWTDRLGVRLGQTWFATGSHARLPLVHVESCAKAIVMAAETPAAIGQTLNIIDNDPPTQRQYRRVLQRVTEPTPRIVPINWTLIRLGVWMIDAINRRLLQGRARLPAILRRRALHARCRPLRYTNRRARAALGWTPTHHWRDALTNPPPTQATDQASNALSTTTAQTPSAPNRTCDLHT